MVPSLQPLLVQPLSERAWLPQLEGRREHPWTCPQTWPWRVRDTGLHWGQDGSFSACSSGHRDPSPATQEAVFCF